MKTRVICILLVIVSLSGYSGAQPIIKAYTTGKLFGNVIRVEVDNRLGEDDFLLSLNPFYLPFLNKFQGYVIPGAHVIRVPAVEKGVFYLQGYGTDISKPLQKANAEIEWPIIAKLSKPEILPYDSVVNRLVNYNVIKMDEAELIPFDFIVTHPGTHDPLKYYFDIEMNYELTQLLLVNYTWRLENAFSRLKTAGKIVTHFNNDPYYERMVITQMAVWIASAGLDGQAIKKADLKKALFDFYKAAGGEENMRAFNKSYSRYHNILKTIGQEARVFIVPEDMDKPPSCLPQVVGFQPTHRAVKTPGVATKRFEIYPVANQKFLNENNCLPCKVAEGKTPLIKIFLLEKLLDDQLDEILTPGTENAIPVTNGSLVDWLKQMEDFNPAEWLNPVNFDKKPETEILKNYLESRISALKNLINTNPENPEAVQFNSFLQQAENMAEWLLLLYQNNNLEFSLDCCNLDQLPSDDLFRLAARLLDLNDQSEYLSSIADRNNTGSEELAVATKAMVAVLTRLFTFRTDRNQYIAVGESLPDGESALNFLEEFYKIKMPAGGKMINGRFILEIDTTSRLIFVFDAFSCGRYRESTIAFLPKKQGTVKLVDDQYIGKVCLDRKIELSGEFGQRWMNEAGAEWFKGGTVLQIRDQIDNFGFDSIFRKFYNYDYYFTASSGFYFANVIDYSFSAGYELMKNLQVRVNAGNSRGFVEGYLPIHYYENLKDSSTATTKDLLVRSKFNAVYAGAGVRYYFGIKYQPFAGAGFQISRHSNNSVLLYTDFAELQLPPSDTYNISRYTIELGLRYRVNREFFVEAGGRLIQRELYNTNGYVSDFSLFGGAGLHF